MKSGKENFEANFVNPGALKEATEAQQKAARKRLAKTKTAAELPAETKTVADLKEELDELFKKK